jgi:SulP family sulfate permease
VAILATTVGVALLRLPVETIGSRFGDFHVVFSAPRLPAISGARLRELASPSVTIALLAAIESLLSAVVADGMIGSRHKSNVELVGQGIANIASGLFGGMPATGAIARTATNVKNGGRTPVAGMVHVLTIVLVTAFFGRYIRFVPLATLAAVLVVVAYHMSEWRTFATLFRAPRSDVLVLLTTFLLTIVVDLTVAVQVGVVLASFLFMKRMADVTNVGASPEALRRADGTMTEDAEGVFRRTIPPGVEVYRSTAPSSSARRTRSRTSSPSSRRNRESSSCGCATFPRWTLPVSASSMTSSCLSRTTAWRS